MDRFHLTAISLLLSRARTRAASWRMFAGAAGLAVVAWVVFGMASAPMQIITSASAQSRPVGMWLAARVSGDVRVRKSTEAQSAAIKMEDVLGPLSEVVTGRDGSVILIGERDVIHVKADSQIT